MTRWMLQPVRRCEGGALMICPPCRDTWHEECDNNRLPADRVAVQPEVSLWCYCQHKDRDDTMVIAAMTYKNSLEG